MAAEPWVVLDTDVWIWLYGQKRHAHPSADTWRLLLTGRGVVIATQTRAEVLVGLAVHDVGPRRAAAIESQLASTPTVPVTEDVIRAYAELTARCRRSGHALHKNEHTGDRWVAATAVAIGAPLLTIDGIYRDAPDLDLLDSSNR